MSLTGLGGRIFSSPRLSEEEALSLPRPEVAGWSEPPNQPNLPAPVVEDAVKAWNWREIGSNVAEISGISAISAGFWLITPSAGLISGGIGLILVGLSVSSG